jgi:cell wall-associated NlpC family hydrolase
MIDVNEFVKKYLGQKVGAGISPCFRWVKKFYHDEFGIKIPYDYLEMLKDFRSIEEASFGDIVVMKALHDLVPDHLGIYLERGEFAHCGAGCNSDEVVIGSVTDFLWKTKIMGYLRHKSR